MFLQRIRFDITINPVRLSGGIGVSAGPRLFGTEAVSVNGDFTYEEGSPDRYAIRGSARIVDIPLASGSVSYQTDGRFDMSAQATFRIRRRVRGRAGGLGRRRQRVQLPGQRIGRRRAVPQRRRRGGLVVGRRGVPPRLRPGRRLRLRLAAPRRHIFASSCNVGDWVVGGSTRQAGPPTFGSFAIAGGQPAAVFSVVGTLAPPKAILTGPDGATVAATPDDPLGGIDDGKVLLFQNPEDLTTYIAVKDPAGGLYRLSLKPGSAPASVFRSAQSLAAPRVRARVVDGERPSPGAALELHARARALGRVLRAGPRHPPAADGDDAAQRPRRVRRARRPGGPPRDHRHGPPGRGDADGRRGRALHGAAARRPGRPRSLRITARGGVLSVRGGAPRAAASYEVRVVLSDGRSLLFLPKRRGA